MDVNETATQARYQLKDELSMLCLPEAGRDPERKLAWVNSICILFLLIGILGMKPASVGIKPVPPLEEVIPTVLEPAPPPQVVSANPNPEQHQEQQPETPNVVAVTPPSPDIRFAVPTIGTLLVPNAMAEAPPLHPLQPPAPLRLNTANINSTGQGGDRPQPPYPPIALEQGQQGKVTLLMTADDDGNIVSVELKQSSGSAVLDHATLEYVKRHWTLPAGTGRRLFETSITYQLQTD